MSKYDPLASQRSVAYKRSSGQIADPELWIACCSFTVRSTRTRLSNFLKDFLLIRNILLNSASLSSFAALKPSYLRLLRLAALILFDSETIFFLGLLNSRFFYCATIVLRNQTGHDCCCQVAVFTILVRDLRDRVRASGVTTGGKNGKIA